MLISEVCALSKRVSGIRVKIRVVRTSQRAIGHEIIRGESVTIFAKDNSVQFVINNFTMKNFLPHENPSLYITKCKKVI